MDDIQLVIYIVLIAFGIFSKFLKAKKKPVPKKGKPINSREPETPQKQLTFEELLREFTEEKSPQPEPMEEVSYEADFDIRDDDEIKRIYEKAKLDSKKYEVEASHDDRHTGNFQHFKGYSEEDTEEEASEYAKLLNDPDSARKAIIMSEIINRKY